MSGKSVDVIIDRRKLKRFAVTCRCGERTVAEIPGEVISSGMPPIITCKCGQQYALRGDRLIRLDQNMAPEKVVEKKSNASAAVTHVAAQEEIAKTLESLRRKGFTISVNNTKEIS